MLSFPKKLVTALASLLAAASLHAQSLPLADPTATIAGSEEEAFPNGPANGPIQLQFGRAIATSGRTVLVGIPGIGHVAIFNRDNSGRFTRVGTLVGPNGDLEFGRDVAVGFDLALVRGGQGVYVFRRSGNVFTPTQKISPQPGEAFGKLALDFRLAAVGVGNDNNGTAAVDIYLADFRGKLRRVNRVAASDGTPGDGFGEQLALQLNVLAVGAPFADSFQGAVYLFDLFSGSKSEYQKLVATDGKPNEEFGAAVALEDGILAVGKPVVTSTTNVMTPGSVYLFRPFGHFWSEVERLTDPANLVGFGANVVVNREFLAVSSLGAFPFSESVTVIYRRQGPTYIPKALTRSDLSTSELALGREFLYASLEDSRNFPSTVRIYNLRELAP